MGDRYKYKTKKTFSPTFSIKIIIAQNYTMFNLTSNQFTLNQF